MAPLDVLVLGATGRYSALVTAILAAGHQVRAATRDPKAAGGLQKPRVRIVRVDLDDVDSIADAARGADAVFAAGTFHKAGPVGDVLHGRNVVDASQSAEVAHLIYVSVAGAEEQTEVPLFQSKRRVEDYLRASDVPFTIIAPVYFMENLWNPWNLPVLERGRFPSPVPAPRTLQQIPIQDVIEFASFVLGHRQEFVGQRVEIASDELSALDAATIISDLTGRMLDVEVTASGGPTPLFTWLDRVGYAIDVEELRRRFPEIGWRRFREWAKTQDWSMATSLP